MRWCIEEDVDPQNIGQDDGHNGIDKDGRYNTGARDIWVPLYLTTALTHLVRVTICKLMGQILPLSLNKEYPAWNCR